MRDFLGSILLSVNDIKEVSDNESKGKWFKLDSTKSGEIRISVKIITEQLGLSVSTFIKNSKISTPVMLSF